MRKTATIMVRLLAAAAMIVLVHQPLTAGSMDCVEGSGVPHQETRVLAPFTRLSVNGAYEVRLKIGPSQRVAIRGDDNILPHILTEVHDGMLKVHSDRSICIKTDLRLEIDVPQLKGLESRGTVDLEAEGIHGSRFDMKLDGTGNARVAGQCERFEAELLGTSELQAEALRSSDVMIRLEGAGNATVYAARRLDAVINGVGTVTYAGRPVEINPNITGLGELIPR